MICYWLMPFKAQYHKTDAIWAQQLTTLTPDLHVQNQPTIKFKPVLCSIHEFYVLAWYALRTPSCFFVSSPDHEVPRMGFCDRAMSVVQLASPVVNVLPLEATFSVRYTWNFIRIFVLLKARTSFKMGHVGSKTRSLNQIFEKLCVRS